MRQKEREREKERKRECRTRWCYRGVWWKRMQPPLVRAHPFPAHPWLPSTLESPSTSQFLVETTSTTSFIGQRPDRARNIESPPLPCAIYHREAYTTTLTIYFYISTFPHFHRFPLRIPVREWVFVRLFGRRFRRLIPGVEIGAIRGILVGDERSFPRGKAARLMTLWKSVISSSWPTHQLD